MDMWAGPPIVRTWNQSFQTNTLKIMSEMRSWLFYKYWPLSTNILIFKQQVFHSRLHRSFQSTKPTSNKTIQAYSAFTSYCFLFLNKVQNWVISPGRCGHRSQNGRSSCDRRALPLLSNSTTEDVKKKVFFVTGYICDKYQLRPSHHINHSQRSQIDIVVLTTTL